MKQKYAPNDYITNTGLEIALEKLYAKFSDEMKNYRDENMTRLDEVMGELQAIREDNTIGTYQIRELRETSEDHEKRLVKLEPSL